MLNEVCEQQNYEQNKYHSHDCKERNNNIASHRISMRRHGAEEDQHTGPNIRDCKEQCDKLRLGQRQEIRANRRRDPDQRDGKQRIGSCNKDVLEAAFTVKQRRQAPVRNSPQEQRAEDRDDRNKQVYLPSAAE